MKHILFSALLFLPLCCTNSVIARGQKKTDSLIAALPAAKEDSNKVLLLNTVATAFYGTAPDSTAKYAQQGLDLAKKINWQKGAGSLYNLLGGNSLVTGEVSHALDYFLEGMKVYEEIGDKERMGHEMRNISIIYISQGNYPKALEYAFRALKIHEDGSSKEVLAGDYGIVGAIYLQAGDCPKALEYTLKSLAIHEERHDSAELRNNYINIGAIYKTQKDYPHALAYYMKSLNIARASQLQPDIATAYSKIGEIYRLQGSYSTALAYEFNALRCRDTSDIGNTARALGNIGQTYLAIGKDSAIVRPDSLVATGKTANLEKAIAYLKKALHAGPDALDLSSISIFSLSLSEAQKLTGNYKEALESYIQSVAAQDSLFSTESTRKIANVEADRAAELNGKKLEVQQLQITSDKNARKYYIAGIGLLALVSLTLFGRFRIVRRNKSQLEEKNKTIAAEKDYAEAQRQRAEQSERFKQEFLANMSHEIRTPMNAVNGMTDLLIAKNPRQDQLNYLKVISRSSDILLHIINDILDLSKIEVGKMELEAIDFSLSDAIIQVTDTLSFRAEEKGLQLITTIDDDISDVLIGDPYRLNQILINLGGNAIKFTQRGSVEIKVERLDKNGNNQRLRFSVIDTGIGIPAGKIEKLFESFEQVNRSDTRRYGGTGLGLSISKQLVELQGGAIAVESEEGHGSAFSFILNYETGSAERLQHTRHEHSTDGSRLNGLRILLADDNEYNRLVVSETLHLKAEVTIDEAVNGLKAVQLAEQNNYDVILMDVQMPEMNGFEATKYIREQLPSPKNKVPVIALTASMLKHDIETFYQCGMNTFIPKPFKAWQLINTIAEQTGRSEALYGDSKQGITIVHTIESGITDLIYLTRFCEGDKERIRKYIDLYFDALPGFAQQAEAAITAGSLPEIAALMHTFKPKWMMMGMKQASELGYKIEILCDDSLNLEKIKEYLLLLSAYNKQSVTELNNLT